MFSRLWMNCHAIIPKNSWINNPFHFVNPSLTFLWIWHFFEFWLMIKNNDTMSLLVLATDTIFNILFICILLHQCAFVSAKHKRLGSGHKETTMTGIILAQNSLFHCFFFFLFSFSWWSLFKVLAVVHTRTKFKISYYIHESWQYARHHLNLTLLQANMMWHGCKSFVHRWSVNVRKSFRRGV